MGFGTRYTTGGLGFPVVPIDRKITYTTNALVSSEEPAAPESVNDCTKVTILDVELFKSFDPLNPGYIGAGKASVDCYFAPYLQVELENPPPHTEDNLFTGSIEEGNLRYLYVTIERCCEDCTCELEGRGSISFKFNTTPSYAKSDMLENAERAFHQLGDCDGCSPE